MLRSENRGPSNGSRSMRLVESRARVSSQAHQSCAPWSTDTWTVELSILTDDRIMTDCQFRSLKFGVVPQTLGAPFGSAPSIITSVHSPWQRMASARQFASRIAKSLDRNGVILHSPIRIDQPFCSLITLKVIMVRHQK